MNRSVTQFVLGYHGCARAVAESIFVGEQALRTSRNDYDWLGHGIYFWEHNARRAHQFAIEALRREAGGSGGIVEPAVVGAVIDLGLCLNLLDGDFLPLIGDAHSDLIGLHRTTRQAVPRNEGGPDLLLRRLDCAVVELLHANRRRATLPPFDTVRAAFVEGPAIYPDAGFHWKNHIQVCVRDPACIRGYFRPLDDAGRPMRFR